MTSSSGTPFAKLHGAGNDFVLVDGRRLAAPTRGAEQIDWAVLARQTCDRHLGIGADGLLIATYPDIRPVRTGEATVRYRMRMLNPDGSESEMCGNGLRCFVRWLHDEGEIGAGQLAVQTGAGVLLASVDAGGDITVNMGQPRLSPAEIPLAVAAAAGFDPHGPVLDLPLDLAAGSSDAPGEWSPVVPALRVTCVSMGNPHAVAFVSAVKDVPLERLGPIVERHPFFPARTNFELCEVMAPDLVRVRVWERGAGLTLACGTGACAALVAARLHGFAAPRVRLILPGGELVAEWRGSRLHPSYPVFLGGPTARVFDGLWRAPLPLLEL